MTNRIRNFAIKKIWIITLLLLIITIMGVSIAACTHAEIYNSRTTSTPHVVLGTGHLIDGYHVVYGENLEATWTAQSFRLGSNGSFMLYLEYNYVSENPSKVCYHADNILRTHVVDLEYVASVVILQVGAVYELEPWGDFVHGDMTGLVPLVPKSEDSKSCLIEYEGKFLDGVNVTKVMSLAYGFEVKLSWVRIFAKKYLGTLYYQWLQGASDVWGGEMLEVDKTYSNISDRFSVYYPIPQELTSFLRPYEFDYVKWIWENALGSLGIVINVGKGGLLVPYNSFAYIGFALTIAVATIVIVVYFRRVRCSRNIDRLS